MATAVEALEASIRRVIGREPYRVRFPGESDAHDGVRYRVIGMSHSNVLDGAATSVVTTFEVECRTPEAYGGRREVDDLLDDLGEHVEFVLSRYDWLDVGKVGRDHKRQRTYSHLATFGLASEIEAM